MAAIREHFASQGLGLHNDLQNEHSIVGNFPVVIMLDTYGREDQKKAFIPGQFTGETRICFGLTEAAHGSDATTWARAKPGRAAASRLAHRRREDVDHRHAPRHALRGLRPHVRQGRRRRASLVSSCRCRARGLVIEEICGRSTCRRTTRACR